MQNAKLQQNLGILTLYHPPLTIGVHSTELHNCRPSLDAESSLKLVLIDSKLRRSEQCDRTGDVVVDDATGVVGVDILARLFSRLS